LTTFPGDSSEGRDDPAAITFCTQAKLGLANGTIRATVLIDTIPAAIEMDEILPSFGTILLGSIAARWDYIFGFIKKILSKTQIA
jgi:malate synthase